MFVSFKLEDVLQVISTKLVDFTEREPSWMQQRWFAGSLPVLSLEVEGSGKSRRSLGEPKKLCMSRSVCSYGEFQASS